LSKIPDDHTPSADLARLLLDATRIFERTMIERLAEAGLDMLGLRHLLVLRGLNADQGARASELAREAGVTRQAIGQVIAELERLDIVTQIPDPNDARAKIVRYTPFGKRGYLQALAVFTQLEHEAIQIIRPSRIAALKRDLERLSSIGAS
jgi:DNA-binding MarR family transcriptional regulator